MYCSTCGSTSNKDRLFERPPCTDGHGEDCPELACTGCGTALLSALPPTQAPPTQAPPTQAPPTQNTPPAERSTSAPFRAA